MSLWVHPSTVINILPGYGNINTTIQTSDVEVVLVTVSRSGCLLELDYGWLIIGARPIYCFGRECVAILIDPPISVDGNKILARVYLPVI